MEGRDVLWPIEKMRALILSNYKINNYRIFGNMFFWTNFGTLQKINKTHLDPNTTILFRQFP